jgi:hypothetical protein
MEVDGMRMVSGGGDGGQPCSPPTVFPPSPLKGEMTSRLGSRVLRLAS